MLEIEKGVPIPEWPPRVVEDFVCGSEKYPFRDLEIGDSFYVPIRYGENVQQTAKRIAPRVCRESYGERKFITRKCLDGVRVWRVA